MIQVGSSGLNCQEEASIAVPWGPDGSLELTFPPAETFADDIEVVSPDLSDPLADYPSALEQALDSPEGSARLEDLVAPGASVAIVVDDPSRWTPVSEALPIVLRRLHAAGVRARRRDDQRRGGPPPRRRRRVDAPATWRLGRGELPLLQPAGGRSFGLCRHG